MVILYTLGHNSVGKLMPIARIFFYNTPRVFNVTVLVLYIRCQRFNFNTALF